MNVQDDLSAQMLGTVIEQARIAQGLTRDQVAERIQKSGRYVASIERAERTPSIQTLYQLIRSLGISADAIFYPEANEKDSSISEIRRLAATCTPEQQEFIIKFIRLFKQQDAKETQDKTISSEL